MRKLESFKVVLPSYMITYLYIIKNKKSSSINIIDYY